MSLSALPTLIAAGVSQTLEFKASFDKACIATLVAFANAQGGTVLVGVSDAGVVLGTAVGKEISDLYLQSLQLSWDAYEAQGYTTAQLDPTKIQRFIRLVNQHGRFALDETDSLGALQKLSYLKNGHPTWAAVLLFATDPIRHNVHIGRFKTPDMIIDDRQLSLQPAQQTCRRRLLPDQCHRKIWQRLHPHSPCTPGLPRGSVRCPGISGWGDGHVYPEAARVAR